MSGSTDSTHYWSIRGRGFNSSEWIVILSAVRSILANAEDDGVKLAGPFGMGEPVLDIERIALNGSADEKAEPFVLSRRPGADSVCECDTEGRPYDAVVESILAAAKRVAPDILEISAYADPNPIRIFAMKTEKSARFPKGKPVDVPEWLRGKAEEYRSQGKKEKAKHLEEAAREWAENEEDVEEGKDPGKNAALDRVSSDSKVWGATFMKLDRQFPRFDATKVRDFNLIKEEARRGGFPEKVAGSVAHYYRNYRAGEMSLAEAAENLARELRSYRKRANAALDLALREIHLAALRNPNSKVASLSSAEGRVALARKMADKWIEDAIKRPGRVHEYLGIPEGTKIPMGKLDAAIAKVKAEGGNLSLLRALQLAKTLKQKKWASVLDAVSKTKKESSSHKTARDRRKLVVDGKNIRVKVDDTAAANADIYVEELPTKPLKKRQMRQLYIPYPGGGFKPGDSAFLASNVLRDAKISKGDTYDVARKKLEKALDMAGKSMQKAFDESKDDKWRGRDASPWFPRPSESTVHYLQVEPSDYKPLEAKAKDFNVHAEWNQWKAYDPDSDFQSHDPTYTVYEAKSPAAARKMYKLLKARPDALKDVTWSKFSNWLDKNKIKYNIRFSVYR